MRENFKKHFGFFSIIIFSIIFINIVNSEEIGAWYWTRQWGTASSEWAFGVATDSSGNIYVTGSTYGELDGNTNAGGSDIYLTKYNASGVKQWTRQWGSADNEVGREVAIDGSGNIYVTGSTWGELDGNTNAGLQDVFLTKFDSSGTKIWTRQWGTADCEEGLGVATDGSGNIYVTGKTRDELDGNTHAGHYDIFLTKYDSSGIKQWTKQWGTEGHDYGESVAIDSSGNIYVTGDTGGGLDGNTNAGSVDIFLTKCDPSGNKLWTKQWGTAKGDYGEDVATDSSGYIYVTGDTGDSLDGNMYAGIVDIFLTKYDSSGVKQWTKQWGTADYDYGYGVVTDSSEYIYVTGHTFGELDGNTNAGALDIFLTKYNSSGVKQWTRQWGTTDYDYAYGGITESSENIYVTGHTCGGFDGNINAGGLDIFLTKWNKTNIPELSWTGEMGYESDGLNPEIGKPNNTFTYRIKYTDMDDDAPDTDFPKVHILKAGAETSGSPFTMNEVDPIDTTYTDGKLYTFEKVFNNAGGDYTYYFEAQDIYRADTATTSIDAPDVGYKINGTITFGVNPMSGVTVNLSADLTATTITDSNGSYSFNYLNADAAYIITPKKTHYYTFSPVNRTYSNLTVDITNADFNGIKLFSANLENFIVYPNPWKKDSGTDFITFDNLTKNSKIQIYTISGELFHEIEADNIEYQWDIKTENIASGIYLYVVINKEGEKKTGKFAIIK